MIDPGLWESHISLSVEVRAFALKDTELTLETIKLSLVGISGMNSGAVPFDGDTGRMECNGMEKEACRGAVDVIARGVRSGSCTVDGKSV